jgi:hypothetical protein
VPLGHFQQHLLHHAHPVLPAKSLSKLDKPNALLAALGPMLRQQARRPALRVAKTSSRALCSGHRAQKFASAALTANGLQKAPANVHHRIAQSVLVLHALLFLAEASKSGLFALFSTALLHPASPLLQIVLVMTIHIGLILVEMGSRRSSFAI